MRLTDFNTEVKYNIEGKTVTMSAEYYKSLIADIARYKELYEQAKSEAFQAQRELRYNGY